MDILDSNVSSYTQRTIKMPNKWVKNINKIWNIKFLTKKYSSKFDRKLRISLFSNI